MIQIVNVKEEHLPRIYEIEKETISPPWSYETLLSEVDKFDSHFFAAIDDDVLGFAILQQVGNDGELHQIAVAGSSQRRGVGDLLLRAVIDCARENMFKSIFLEVRESNSAAVCLYKNHEFATIRVRKDYYNDPIEDALIMVRRDIC